MSATFQDTNGHQLQTHETRFHQEADAVKRDFQALKTDAVNCARAGVDVTREAVRGVADKAQETHAQVCTRIRSRPMTSVLIALGVGALCGRLLR